MFWFVILVLGAVAGLFVVMPYFLRGQETIEDRDELNVDLFHDRLQDLDTHALDDTGPEGPESLALEAKLALLDDTGDKQSIVYTQGSFRTLLVFALALPLFGLIVYHESGLNQGAIDDVHIATSLEQLSPDDPDAYARFTAQLLARLDSKPDDVDLRFLLASAYANQGLYDEAVIQYGDLAKRFPDDASVASRHAEVLFIADGRRLTPRAEQAVSRALGLNPMDITMLEVRAIGAMMSGDTGGALNWFNRALQTGVQGRRAELIRLAVRQIQQDSSPTAAAPSSAEPSVPNEPAGKRQIVVSVAVDPSVSVQDNAVVFIYARAEVGPRAPLAVQRLPVSALPTTVTLDESMAMMPGMGLLDFDSVVVLARISKSGQVVPAPGDYEARSEPIALTDGSYQLNLVISEQL